MRDCATVLDNSSATSFSVSRLVRCQRAASVRGLAGGVPVHELLPCLGRAFNGKVGLQWSSPLPGDRAQQELWAEKWFLVSPQDKIIISRDERRMWVREKPLTYSSIAKWSRALYQVWREKLFTFSFTNIMGFFPGKKNRQKNTNNIATKQTKHKTDKQNL